jgi:hypothetical protein
MNNWALFIGCGVVVRQLAPCRHTLNENNGLLKRRLSVAWRSWYAGVYHNINHIKFAVASVQVKLDVIHDKLEPLS